MSAFPPIARQVVSAAIAGDVDALETLASAIRQRAYNLAVRFLWNPEDAEDAAQDIVVATLAALPRFRGDSSFSTYAYAVAVRKLRGRAFSPMERAGLSFEAYVDDAGPPSEAPTIVGRVGAADRTIMEHELKRSCTYGMLICLDREDRLAYVLHAFFALEGAEAASAMGVTHAAYRKRLSRVRSRMAAFMGAVCGLAGSARCRCEDRIDYAAALGRIDPRSPLFTERTGLVPPAEAEIDACLESMEALDAAAAVFRSDGVLAADGRRAEAASALIAALRPAVLRSALKKKPARGS
jgi:RNA polymerase sigma factor (sigma-70 family)